MIFSGSGRILVEMTAKFLKNRPLKKAILEAVDNLPPMPQVMHKAQAIINDPDSSMKDLEKLINTDQAFAIKVLRLANSAFYGRMKKVASIQDAAVVVGMKSLGELITLSCAASLLNQSLRGYDLPAQSLWQHSIGVAFGSKIIAGKKYPALVNDAFSAGLIHDAGKLILDEYLYERKTLFQEFMSDNEHRFLDAEREILGFDHAEIAAQVCEKWNFPKTISAAIRHHHRPSRLGSNKLAYIVQVADQITSWIGMDTDGIILEISDDSLEVVGVEVEEITQIADEVSEYVDQMINTVEGVSI